MIKIAGNETDPATITNGYTQGSIERKILEILSSSNETYMYDSPEQLKFELNIRKNIIFEARQLYNAGLHFRTFRESVCNRDYWDRTDDGGFSLKNGVKPSEAIKDIYRNARKYGTECATAIVIIFYKAVLDVFGDERFNTVFPKIQLMNWMHVDDTLGVFTYRNPADYLPGDCRYFKNPDVNPLTPEWQGENAIDLANGTYYGHGIGINSADKMIDALNDNRISGSTVTAYLMDTATRPDFKSLYHNS